MTEDQGKGQSEKTKSHTLEIFIFPNRTGFVYFIFPFTTESTPIHRAIETYPIRWFPNRERFST